MSKGIQIVLKCLAVLLALGMLSGYVWTRQRAAAPEASANVPIDVDTEFPVTPASPTLFDTSKSGKLTVDPALFSSSKLGLVHLPAVPLPKESESTLDVKLAEDPFLKEKIEAANSDGKQMTIISGSKNFNGPLFDTTKITKAITIWDGQTIIDADSESTSKSGPVDLDVTLVPEEKVDFVPPVYLSSSKSLSTPVFAFSSGDFVRLRDFTWPPVSQIKKWQSNISELIQAAEGDAWNPRR